jgi:Zn-dependent peptidase ImmA (M78 family)/DNA-binding XRE family transcriptional regulator
MIDGARLKQAREVLALTQAALAERCGLTQSVLSRIEMGNYETSPADVRLLADALEVPVNFLFARPIRLPDGSLGLFRSQSSKVKSTEYRSARRLAEIGIEAILKMSRGVSLPSPRIQEVAGADPEEAARFAREMLRLPPDDPIDNLTLALERAGVLVIRLSGLDDEIIGFSAWIDPVAGYSEVERPMIVTRRPLTPFRLRFTLGHELGHLVLRHQVFSGPKRPVEREANSFSQALLLPREPALEDLSVAPLTLERLATLKGKWGVSMHALAMRAKSLAVIDDTGYRNIYENLRYKGFLKREPGDLTTPTEQPRLLNELIAKRGLESSVYDLAEELNLGVQHVRKVLGDDANLPGLGFGTGQPST